jgi:hypothetical protein
VTADQGGAGRTREPAAADGSRVSGGSVGGRSQDEAGRSTGQDGVQRTEAGGEAIGSSCTGAADGGLTCSSTSGELLGDGAGLRTSSSSGAGGLTDMGVKMVLN